MKKLTLAASLLVAPLALGLAAGAEAGGRDHGRGHERGRNVVVVKKVYYPAPAARYRHEYHDRGHHYGYYRPYPAAPHYYYQSGYGPVGLVPIIAGGVIGGVIGNSVGQGEPVPIVAGTIIGSVIGHEVARH